MQVFRHVGYQCISAGGGRFEASAITKFLPTMKVQVKICNLYATGKYIEVLDEISIPVVVQSTNYSYILSTLLFHLIRNILIKLFIPTINSTVMSVYIPPITRLSFIVVRILGCNPGPMTLQGTNTYVIGSGPRRILLDTGEKNVPEFIDRCRDFLKTENISFEHIIISHWHRDHIGGLEDILSLLPNSDCKVWKHRRTDATESDFDNKKLQELKDGQEFTTEGATLRIIHTPGHTTDHVVLHLKEENAIFTADCILGEGTTVFENLTQYMNSLYEIKALEPSIIYPGHGPEITSDALARVQLYIDHRVKREDEILSLLRNSTDNMGYTSADLVEILYAGTPKHLHLAASYNMKQHLQKLLTEGKVKKVEDNWKVSKL